MSIQAASARQAEARAEKSKVVADQTLSPEGKAERYAEISRRLKTDLDTMRTQDQTTTVARTERLTARARGVQPSQQSEYRTLQDRVVQFDTPAKAKVERDRAAAAGDTLALHALGLHLYDQGMAQESVLQGAGSALLEIAQTAPTEDQVDALNTNDGRHLANPFDMLAYHPTV